MPPPWIRKWLGTLELTPRRHLKPDIDLGVALMRWMWLNVSWIVISHVTTASWWTGKNAAKKCANSSWEIVLKQLASLPICLLSLEVYCQRVWKRVWSEFVTYVFMETYKRLQMYNSPWPRLTNSLTHSRSTFMSSFTFISLILHHMTYTSPSGKFLGRSFLP